ncbi:MAG: hypothetical protein LBK59_07180 [Bifidobacteriaceae bacterium]|nr:hypothetical protein [Bifidobacteriaceae bacterium]
MAHTTVARLLRAQPHPSDPTPSLAPAISDTVLRALAEFTPTDGRTITGM